MPTITKLFAAVFFAAIAFVSAEAVKVILSEGIRFGPFTEICAVIGLACGWTMSHRNFGRGYVNGVNVGFRIVAIMTIWCLLAGSTALMIRKAFRKMYDTPLESLVDIFKLIFENAPVLLNSSVFVPLLLGGLIGGVVAEWIARRWD